MRPAILILLLAIAAAGCTSPKSAERALSGAGYTDVQTTGWRFIGCGSSDWYHTGFVATDPTGKRVSGVVCSGLLYKGSTIRLD